MITMDAALDRN